MPADSTLLLGLLFVIAVAAGWFLGRRGFQAGTRPKPPAPDYYAGLNYLLNDQPDKALEKFLKLVEVDDSTLETHFALASIFRRRGEVDRAIRIHQNIIARPSLDPAQRNHALFALGEDYLRAGLFDRAEKLFLELATLPGQRVVAMQNLLRIYEQQSDWSQAIKVRRKLQSLQPERSDNVVSHYYCELAAQAMQGDDAALAKHFLKKAAANNPPTVRAELMRAQLAAQGGDPDTAAKLLQGIAQRDARFAAEALIRVHALDDAGEHFQRTIAELHKRNAAACRNIAYAAIVTGARLDATSRAVIAEFVQSNTVLVAMLEQLDIRLRTGADANAVIGRIAAALRRLADETPRYRCHDCGYSADRLYWQCPGCKAWETSGPNAALRFNVQLNI